MKKLFPIIHPPHAVSARREGSALLVVLLVMGVLLTLMLGVSYLVVREIRQTGDIVLSGKAYYAAEAGIEEALYDLSQSLPGYETVDLAEDGWVTYEPLESPAGGGVGGGAGEDTGLLTGDLSYRYRIDNKGDTVPYFEDDQPIFLTPDRAVPKSVLYGRDALLEDAAHTYNILPLNQTVTIPLFTDDDEGGVDNVESFLVQYYVNFEIDNEEFFQEYGRTVPLEHFDILRWKLFGNPKCEGDATTCIDAGKTEAISDFFPAKSGATPKTPVCIGSDIGLRNNPPSGLEYTCHIPIAYDLQDDGEVVPTSDEIWSMARECYATDSGFAAGNADGDFIYKNCTIRSFVEKHTRNYITLTNVVNPDIVGVSNPELRNARANIYYRIIAKQDGPKLTRDAAHIRADGYAGGGKIVQSIDTSIKMSSFLPVFNFSLYRTDTENPLFSPSGDGDVSASQGSGLGF